MIKTKLYMVQIGTYTQKIEKSKSFCLIKSGPARTGPGRAQTGPESWKLEKFNENYWKLVKFSEN